MQILTYYKYFNLNYEHFFNFLRRRRESSIARFHAEWTPPFQQILKISEKFLQTLNSAKKFIFSPKIY